MKIQPKFKWDRQWDYFTSLRTSVFYNWYSQKQHTVFRTDRSAETVLLDKQETSLKFLLVEKHVQTILVFFTKTANGNGSYRNWPINRIHQGTERTTCKSCSGDTWSEGRLLISSPKSIGKGGTTTNHKNPSSKNGASLLYIQQSLLFIQQKSLNKNHPQRLPQMLNCQLAGGPIGFVDEAMLATPPFTRELHLAEMSWLEGNGSTCRSNILA